MKQALGKLGLRVFGWTMADPIPPERRFVLIAYPHTSNWDYVFMILSAWAYGTPLHWLGKQELFKSPLGPFFRWTGGIPVDRSKAGNLVAQAIERFAAEPDFILVVPPSGTRKDQPYWKSGFYQIAVGAGVPINLATMDYLHRRAGYGPNYMPTGDPKVDMDHIRSYYAVTHGKYPERRQPIRLRLEDESASAPPSHEA